MIVGWESDDCDGVTDARAFGVFNSGDALTASPLRSVPSGTTTPSSHATLSEPELDGLGPYSVDDEGDISTTDD